MTYKAYRVQTNLSTHLVEFDNDGKHFRYIPFIPNLPIPTTYTKRYKKDHADRGLNQLGRNTEKQLSFT